MAKKIASLVARTDTLNAWSAGLDGRVQQLEQQLDVKEGQLAISLKDNQHLLKRMVRLEKMFINLSAKVNLQRPTPKVGAQATSGMGVVPGVPGLSPSIPSFMPVPGSSTMPAQPSPAQEGAAQGGSHLSQTCQ